MTYSLLFKYIKKLRDMTVVTIDIVVEEPDKLNVNVLKTYLLNFANKTIKKI